MVLQNAMLQKYVVVVRTLEAAGEESRLFKMQTGNGGVLLGLTVCYTLGRNYAILKKKIYWQWVVQEQSYITYPTLFEQVLFFLPKVYNKALDGYFSPHFSCIVLYETRVVWVSG